MGVRVSDSYTELLSLFFGSRFMSFENEALRNLGMRLGDLGEGEGDRSRSLLVGEEATGVLSARLRLSRDLERFLEDEDTLFVS